MRSMHTYNSWLLFLKMFIFKRVVFNWRCQLYRSPAIGVAGYHRILCSGHRKPGTEVQRNVATKLCVWHSSPPRCRKCSSRMWTTAIHGMKSPNGRSSISFAHAKTITHRTKNCHRIGRQVQSCQPTCPFAASVPGVTFVMLTKIV